MPYGDWSEEQLKQELEERNLDSSVRHTCQPQLPCVTDVTPWQLFSKPPCSVPLNSSSLCSQGAARSHSTHEPAAGLKSAKAAQQATSCHHPDPENRAL